MSEPAVEVKDDGIIEIRCPEDGCYTTYRWRSTVPGDPSEVEKALNGFRNGHQAQHAPGRTRDVMLEIVATGHCSNCRRSFTWILEDEDTRVWCTHCGASWTQWGTDGRTDIECPE